MRKDISKVVHERERSDHSAKNDYKGELKYVQKAFNNDLIDDLPLRESYSKKKRIFFKEKRPNFNVIDRFLESQVGNDWDAIYSDISNEKPLDHEISHYLDYVVEKNVIEISPGVFVDSKGEEFFYQKFFVNPNTNKLEKAPPRKRYRWKRKADPNFAYKDDKTFYKKDGIWYQLFYKDFPSQNLVWDAFFNEKIMLNDALYKYKSPVYIEKMQQLNGNEIKKNGLSPNIR